jgi:hypothetical protein
MASSRSGTRSQQPASGEGIPRSGHSGELWATAGGPRLHRAAVFRNGRSAMPLRPNLVDRKPRLLAVPHINEAFQEMHPLFESRVIALQSFQAFKRPLEPRQLLPKRLNLPHGRRLGRQVAAKRIPAVTAANKTTAPSSSNIETTLHLSGQTALCVYEVRLAQPFSPSLAPTAHLRRSKLWPQPTSARGAIRSDRRKPTPIGRANGPVCGRDSGSAAKNMNRKAGPQRPPGAALGATAQLVAPPRRVHCNCLERNCVTRLIASARASGFDPMLGECPSGGSFTFVTVNGRFG